MKILAFIDNGSEDSEFVTVVDLLRRGDIDVDIVSLNGNIVTMARGMKLIPDYVLKDIDAYSYDGLFLPGGLKGVDNFLNSSELKDIIISFEKEGKLLSAICAAPLLFDRFGVLKNHNYTMYSGMEKDNTQGNYIDTGVVVDKNFITGKSLNYSVDLGLALVEYIKGSETKEKVKKGIIRL